MRPVLVQAADVYALAITLNEVATGTVPFSDCSKDNPACHTILDAGYGHQELATAVAAELLRPCLPPACPPRWAALMQACWASSPADRPDCSGVLESLNAFAAEEGWACQRPAHLNVSELMQPRAAVSALTDHPDDLVLSQPATGPPPRWQRAAGTTTRPFLPGVYADAGLRGGARMEDRHVIASPLTGTHGVHLLTVCDGHRGAEAADFVAAQLPRLLRHCGHDAADVASAADALGQALAQCETAFQAHEEQRWAARVAGMGLAAAGARPWPGAAVLAALCVGDTLSWANVGDCRAVLCRSGAAVQLTRDHVVSDEQEHARIAAAGGAVHTGPDGSLRVGAAHLQLARSIGDFDAKGSGPAGGLSAEAETGSVQLEAGDEFAVLASDGLWDVVSNADAVALVHDTVKNPSMAAKRLAVEALARGATDNVTVIVCFLQESAALESVYAAGVQKYAPAATFYGSRAAMLEKLAGGQAADEVFEQL